MQTTETQRRSPTPLDLLARQTASALIGFYQEQLSPHKGFSCAYRVLHRSDSCSQYAKRVISEFGIGQALPLMQQRFQQCKTANQTLKAQGCRCKQRERSLLPVIALQDQRSYAWVHQPWNAMEDAPSDAPEEPSAPNEEQARRPGKDIGGGSFRKPPLANEANANSPTSQNNCSDWNCDAIDCASFGCDAIDCSSADWSAIDCNGADCNGLDCSSLDCGSCDVGSCDCS